jgi:hypothetical protein
VRMILILPLLAIGACDLTNDPGNNQVSVQYDRERIQKARDTAEDVAAGVGNVADGTARAIKNEVGDIDVDVDVRRNRPDNGVEPVPPPPVGDNLGKKRKAG